MSGPGLIEGYLDALSRRLPGHVVEELADGLEETYRRHLGLGLAPEAAAQAAAAEFGDPELIAAEFTRVHPARRAARRLLAAGPAVGLCWAVALVTGRAWTWPVPVAAGLMPGVVLMAVVALLAFAARSTRYRSTSRAGVAGCIGTAALDAFMIIGVLAAGPAARWAVAMAITASAARTVLNVSLVRSVLAASGLHDRAASFDEDDVSQGFKVRQVGDRLGMAARAAPQSRGAARLVPKFREDLREIAELTSDGQLLRIAELPEVPVSLEHLRHLDPQTRIVVGYRLDVTPAESPRLCRRLVLSPDPRITLHFDEVPFPDAPGRFWGALRRDMPGLDTSGRPATTAH